MSIDKKFLVRREKRTFVLYAGLLDLAHQIGLQSISTQLLQAPVQENDRVAICAATVTMRCGDQLVSFSGIGDASPGNVAPAMQSCLIRMAETRAKVRALRDATNVEMTAIEELSEEEVAASSGHGPRPAGQAGRCPHCKVTPAAAGSHHRPDCPEHRQKGVAA